MSKLLKSEIEVQEYIVGAPFPGLLYESPGITKPNGDTIGPHAIVLTETGYVVVFPGESMQISKAGGGLYLPGCIGRVPNGYK